MRKDHDMPDDLIRCSIHTRRADAARSYEAGLADSIRTLPSWRAAGILAGAGMDGMTDEDVARGLAEYAAGWMQQGELAAYRVSEGEDGDHLVWTSLRPDATWQPIADLGRDAYPTQPWVVPGVGFAATETAATALAVRGWVFRMDVEDLWAMPTVYLDREMWEEGVLAAGIARTLGLPVETIDQAYGVLRATGLLVSHETLLAVVAGITFAAAATATETEEEPA